MGFKAKDVPPPLRGLFRDVAPGKIACISSGKLFRSNDYRHISAHWYKGQKKSGMYDCYHCRENGEILIKRDDIGCIFPGDKTITLPARGDLTLQRSCRPSHLPLKKVFDPLGL